MFFRQLSRLRPSGAIIRRALSAKSSAIKDSRVFSDVELERTYDETREPDLVDEPNLFPSLLQLGVSTESRAHNFNVPCDKVIQYIKLGAINRNIAIHYCHYLAHLCRNCPENDFSYYNKRSLDLLHYLLRQAKDMPKVTKIRLLADVADTSSKNCSEVLTMILKEDEMLIGSPALYYNKLLSSCHRFGLWETANQFVEFIKRRDLMNSRIFHPLVQALKSSSATYLSSNLSIQEKKAMKTSILKHLTILCEESQRRRVQFITKYPDEFIESLRNLDITIAENSAIKMNGRCTNCNSHLPLYDPNITKPLNDSLKELLRTKADNLFLHSTSEEIEKFESFLNQIHQMDKKPLDCVIDGLNIAYKNSHSYFFHKQHISKDVQRTLKAQNPERQSQVLKNTIIRGNMLNLFRKILVIGKEHMMGWPGLLDFFHEHNIHYYLSNNSSKDDIFQLYASTMNPRTILITNDFLRDHIAALKGDSRLKLERWIDTHQAWISTKNLKPIFPTPFEKIPSVDKETGHFHIPVIDYNKLEDLAGHEPPPYLNCQMITWLCCIDSDLLKDK